ncbi:SAM-dependent methyltransferase [Aquimarina sp. EL_43]|uniref:SAM-dependent methyltransferase n=1 Tax=unclassified Aquimarina TaxID=2627091 RepID=UPI0018CB3171|nr:MULTISPECIES: class I SAM-dependent methyltransferase [unclassified Aquimarina]MBG6132705.1 SAM-dependent methyltransferase [Aquimarina sp. EL_35]MBG6152835.1 SAM-dependent methyltransferase [Aquimarina sp. EL_32]MBG6170842.1 SAM-dependent methyltransferase [Aquimarina sp. EL_43]
MLKDSTMWYASWFDTPYYHILYKDRDHTEAKDFMDNITKYLSLEAGEKILDLACGKGRHSIYLNTLGYDVTGVDLSKNSIEYASQFENETLKFRVHDMCQPYSEKFSAVFNLFTSFGYFDKEEDNLNTIRAIKSNLNEKGFGVIDFMNVDYIIQNLVAQETKEVNNILFNIKRYYQDGYIFKEIGFRDNNEDFLFTERVKSITLSDFKNYFINANVNLLDIFGNYQLQKFDKTTSPRLILIFK